MIALVPVAKLPTAVDSTSGLVGVSNGDLPTLFGPALGALLANAQFFHIVVRLWIDDPKIL